MRLVLERILQGEDVLVSAHGYVPEEFEVGAVSLVDLGGCDMRSQFLWVGWVSG